MSGPLVIYHGNCPDGFCAAWVAHQALQRRFDEPAELYAGEYGKEPPYALAKDRCVYIVDFSYPRAQLERLWGDCSELVVLDHHKTAQAELDGLPYVTFDMERSGAGMTWDYFYPGERRPWIVNYVEDRDLWRFKLPDSELVSLRIRLEPHEVEAYSMLARRHIIDVLGEAKGAKLHLDHLVRDALRNAYDVDNLFGDGESCRVVNMAYTGISDVLNEAIVHGDVRVALGWLRDKSGLIQCSLRSATSLDCSVYAKQLGGGGHAQASGFRVRVDHPLAQLLLGAA